MFYTSLLPSYDRKHSLEVKTPVHKEESSNYICSILPRKSSVTESQTFHLNKYSTDSVNLK